MNTSAWIITAVIALLVAGVFIAGCSDDSTKTGDSVTQPTVTVAESASGALYSEGDIVRNPKSTVNNGLLIIAYDPGTDMYERATVYPYQDGNWGYRTDTKTSKISRTNLEKVYTEKVATVAVSSITIGAPTTAATIATAATTKVTTAATATETTASTSAPKITDIEPFIGTAGTTVSITNLEGSNFVSGATVAMTKTDETSIDATDVSVSSGTKITCKFILPLSTEAGQWNVVVTNPDKQSYTYKDLFTVYKNTSSTTTTSTTTTTAATSSSTGAVTITQIQDPLLVTGGSADYKTVSILGTNLTTPVNMKLTGPTTITATTYSVSSPTYATGYFNIPAGATGSFSVVLVDSSGTTLATSSGTLTIQ
jgi:hypothetical protein